MDRFHLKFLALSIALATSACSVDSAKSRYILAEKLWTDGKYEAAVGEFDRVIQKDPKGKLGLQAMYRSAMTDMLYLQKYSEATRRFKAFVDSSQDPTSRWEAQKQIGEILFSKLEQYDQAISHYRHLLKEKSEDTGFFLYRIAKSHFYLWQFAEAISVYNEIIKTLPQTPWAEKATYEIGVTHFTRGEQNPKPGQSTGLDVYQDAIDAFQNFIKLYPNSQLVPEARFGIASCLEELDQLDAAYHHYEAIQSAYPSPKVIQIKLARIKERKNQKSR